MVISNLSTYYIRNCQSPSTGIQSLCLNHFRNIINMGYFVSITIWAKNIERFSQLPALLSNTLKNLCRGIGIKKISSGNQIYLGIAFDIENCEIYFRIFVLEEVFNDIVNSLNETNLIGWPCTVQLATHHLVGDSFSFLHLFVEGFTDDCKTITQLRLSQHRNVSLTEFLSRPYQSNVARK